jgi:hypothetical protein
VPVAALVASFDRHTAVELPLAADLSVVAMNVSGLRDSIALLDPAVAFFFHEFSVESLECFLEVL